MARKEFAYRGKALKELKEMSIKEFIKLLPSKQRRSLRNGISENHKNVLKKIKEGKKDIKTHCREMVIIPEMVGAAIRVYSGNKFKAVQITEEMIGYRLGDFALTRNSVKHSAPGVGATKSSSSISVK